MGREPKIKMGRERKAPRTSEYPGNRVHESPAEEKLANLDRIRRAEEIHADNEFVYSSIKNEIIVGKQFIDRLGTAQVQLAHQHSVLEKNTIKIKGEHQLGLRSQLAVKRLA
jgi:hypothetical protein